jgi:hypothetical protein
MGKAADIRWLGEPEKRNYPAHGKIVIADGYHRPCAVYSFDEDADIPCKIV